MSNENLASGIAGRAALQRMGGRDIFAKTNAWTLTDDARAMGMYPYFRALDLNQGPEAVLTASPSSCSGRTTISA